MMNWEENVRKVEPYIPGEQPKGEGIIKLNTNENPYPPAPGVKAVLRDFSFDFLRKYPDPNVSDLRNALANYHEVGYDNVFVGVGSDDVLSTAFLTFFNSQKPILFGDITYSFYEVWAKLYGIPYKKVPLREDFTLSKSDYAERNGGIVIANPNAPTGLAINNEAIAQIAYLNPDAVIIIDEAYVDFYKESALPLIRDYDNLLIVRTFSKSRSLAGSRIGYAVGSKKLIDHLLAVRNSINSYTIDSVTSAVGVASVSDDSYFKHTVKKIIATRENFKKGMHALGFEFPDSSANFLFVTHQDAPATRLFKDLRNHGFYVRHFDAPLIDNYLRISIGLDEEMNALLTLLGGLL